MTREDRIELIKEAVRSARRFSVAREIDSQAIAKGTDPHRIIAETEKRIAEALAVDIVERVPLRQEMVASGRAMRIDATGYVFSEEWYERLILLLDQLFKEGGSSNG